MVIGVVGGMGSYATLDFFEKYLNYFRADKEWDRPRIVIDNRCTMPSRVRAILYDEKRNVVVDELTDSIKKLMDAGCDRIILACNTSHVFLDEVYERVPEARECIIHIIDTLAHQLSSKKEMAQQEYALISTEGTILSGIYQKFFNKYGLKIIIPEERSFKQLRFFIETVKTNCYSKEILDGFVEFMREQPSKNLILGCTEFPVIYDKVIKNSSEGELSDIRVFDPLESVLRQLHTEFETPNRSWSNALL